jgi:hypothetical protein
MLDYAFLYTYRDIRTTADSCMAIEGRLCNDWWASVGLREVPANIRADARGPRRQRITIVIEMRTTMSLNN